VSAPVAVPRMLVAEVTDARTRRAHLVTERAFTAGCRVGRFVPVCGDEVLAASVATPDVGLCWGCREWMASRAGRAGR
jgi:hypothetical protein